jgi:hypothetical protein
MAIQKYTTLELNRRDAFVSGQASHTHERTAKLSDFQFDAQPGFLYVTTRAISNRVNANYDGWPPDELRRAYRTFIGRPVYVDHNNWDLNRSRGVIIDAKLRETKLASGHEDVSVEILIEVDAEAFPKLAAAILAGDIDAVSMGADVEYTICSVCGNKAHDVLQYCGHIPQLKGREIPVLDSKTGSQIKKLCFEDCYGVSFFEISFVFDPADESALISDVMLASAGNRALAHLRQPRETVSDYSVRLGTSLTKVSHSVQRQADKALMSLPEPVDTLRDELNCPQCGAEWNGMVCTNCGFELPPEGLGDPDTDPFGVALPEGSTQGNQGQEEDTDEDEDQDNPRAKADAKREQDDKPSPPGKSDSKSKSDGKKPADKDTKSEDKSKDKSKSDSKSKSDNAKKKESTKEVLSVSRYDALRKQATLPQDPTYRQDTSPAQSVPPYGQAIPGGTPLTGFEPALEPAPAAPAEVRDLDAPDVQGPVGQSAVTVVNQPAGPTDTPPPGSQAGEAVNSQGQVAASREERRAAFFRARAAALRARAAEFEKKAETITQTDVRNLDEPPAVDVGADATTDLTKAVDQHEQLLLADTTDVINDGGETGLPAGPDFRERLRDQINPFNDAALAPYSPVNQQVASKEKEDWKCDGCDCKNGHCDCASCEKSSKKKKKAASVEEQQEASIDEAVEAKVREDQRVAAAKTRVLRIANFVDERIDLGLSTPAEKFADIARFEQMDDAMLDGWVQATGEFKAKEAKIAGKRIRVAPTDDNARGPVRMPSLGSVSAPINDDGDPSDDYALFGV